MNITRLLVAVALASSAACVHAQAVDDLTPEFRACIRGTTNQVETGHCMSQELVRQDALVAAELKMAGDTARPEIANRLRKAQAAWTAFRAQDCETKQAAVTGSGATSQYLECMIHHAVLRKIQLGNYWSL